jgi:succinoglycan biosynthesis transport protein ExoP
MTSVPIDPATRASASATMQTPTERMQHFVAALRRRWPAALLVFVLTLASALALTGMQHSKYEATAQILLQPTDAVQGVVSPGNVSSPADAQRDVNTYAQMITVDPVADAVRHQLGLKTALPALVSRISIFGQETSNLVSITAQDSSAAQAARLATAFATQSQAYRKQVALRQIQQALVTSEADPLAKVNGSSVAVRIQELQAGAASETGGVQIVRPASVPSSPVSRKLLTHMLVGLIAALVLAAASVLGLEAVDHRLRGTLQFEAAFGAPVLGTIVGGRRLNNPMRRQVARRRAYTDLAARLAFTSVAEGGRAIMISPASKRESARAFALRLTQALGMLGRRVVLIEADLSAEHAMRDGESDEPGGLTAVLTGRSSFERELTDVHFVAGSSTHGRELEPRALVSYSTLTCGPPVAEPEALLGRAAMREVLEQAEARGDLVLLTTAPLDQPSGVLPLARLCDGVIVLAHGQSTSAEQAQRIVNLLDATDASLLGTVLVPEGSAEQSSMSGQGFAGLVPRSRQANSNGNGQGAHPRSVAGPQED